MQISESYRDQNKTLHLSRPDYGTSGQRWAQLVTNLCGSFNTRDVLDYGCGKGTLKAALQFEIAEYDPCIEGKDTPPSSHKIVVCTDVLEHIEPECLDAVLDDILRCTGAVALMTVATKPAKKFLEDGRNAHICLMPIRDWLNKIQDRFSIKLFQDMGNEFLIIASPL